MDDEKENPVPTPIEETLQSDETQEEHTEAPNEDDAFRKVIELIECGNLKGAQAQLDWFFERGARWFYLQAIVYRRQNWLMDCKQSLEKAVSLEPENEEYKKALEELDAMAKSGTKFRKKKKRSMGGFSDTASCCRVCKDVVCEAIATSGVSCC